MNNPTAPAILQAGIGHMQDRAKTYDKPDGERSMGATVAAFRAVTGIALTEEQGWLFMVLLKAVRSQQGAFKMDSYEDGAAFFGLMGEAAHLARADKPDQVLDPVYQACLDSLKRGQERDLANATLEFDEDRIDRIAASHGDGEHYDAIAKAEDKATFKAITKTVEPPAPELRRPDPVKVKPEVTLPDTSALVDPTGRPAWSDVPSWVKWMGQDRKGVWTGFAAKPEASAGKWKSGKRFIELNSGEPLIGENWVHSLEERP